MHSTPTGMNRAECNAIADGLPWTLLPVMPPFSASDSPNPHNTRTDMPACRCVYSDAIRDASVVARRQGATKRPASQLPHRPVSGSQYSKPRDADNTLPPVYDYAKSNGSNKNARLPTPLRNPKTCDCLVDVLFKKKINKNGAAGLRAT